jgi:hypothetical protein
LLILKKSTALKKMTHYSTITHQLQAGEYANVDSSNYYSKFEIKTLTTNMQFIKAKLAPITDDFDSK